MFIPLLSKPCPSPPNHLQTVLNEYASLVRLPSHELVLNLVRSYDNTSSTNHALCWALQHHDIPLAEALIKSFGASILQSLPPIEMAGDLPIRLVPTPFDIHLFYVERFDLMQCMLGQGDFSYLSRDVRMLLAPLLFYQSVPGYADSLWLPRELPPGQSGPLIPDKDRIDARFAAFSELKQAIFFDLRWWEYQTAGGPVVTPTRSDFRGYFQMAKQNPLCGPSFSFDLKVYTRVFEPLHHPGFEFLFGIRPGGQILVVFQGCRCEVLIFDLTAERKISTLLCEASRYCSLFPHTLTVADRMARGRTHSPLFPLAK